MQIFLTGATGYIGFAVSAALRRHGHRVWGLARNEAKAARLARHEIEPVSGDLGDPKSYAGVAARCSVLIHTAFDYSAEGVAKDQLTIETLLDAGRRGGEAKTPHLHERRLGVRRHGRPDGGRNHAARPHQARRLAAGPRAAGAGGGGGRRAQHRHPPRLRLRRRGRPHRPVVRRAFPLSTCGEGVRG